MPILVLGQKFSRVIARRCRAMRLNGSSLQSRGNLAQPGGNVHEVHEASQTAVYERTVNRC